MDIVTAAADETEKTFCEAAGHHAAAAASAGARWRHVEAGTDVRAENKQVERCRLPKLKTNKQFLRFHISHDRKLYIEHPQAQRRNHGHKSPFLRYSDSQSVAVCLQPATLCMTMMQRSPSDFSWSVCLSLLPLCTRSSKKVSRSSRAPTRSSCHC